MDLLIQGAGAHTSFSIIQQLRKLSLFRHIVTEIYKKGTFLSILKQAGIDKKYLG